MKKLMFALALVAALAVTVEARRARYADVNSKPPKKGTPEFVAVAFVQALVAKDEAACYGLMDTKAKAYYDKKLLAKEFDTCSSWLLKEKFAYKKRATGDKAVVTIKFATKDGGGSFDYTVKRIDGKWLISVD